MILSEDQVTMLSMDSYYRDFPNLSLEERRKLNYDHPMLSTLIYFITLADANPRRVHKSTEYSFELYGRTVTTRL